MLCQHLHVFYPDPRDWSIEDTQHWLDWATKEFSLTGLNVQQLIMTGREMCSLGKEEFLARTPPYLGDILWEHLDMMLRGMSIIQFPCLWNHNYRERLSVIFSWWEEKSEKV